MLQRLARPFLPNRLRSPFFSYFARKRAITRSLDFSELHGKNFNYSDILLSLGLR